MATGVSKNAPIVLLAGQIAKARVQFETMVRRSGLELVFEREARFALQLIQNNDSLQQCDPETVQQSILNVAVTGLSLNPVQGEAALVPRWNYKKKTLDCTVLPMYRGLVRLATESGRVSHVKAELVFKKDLQDFKISMGTNPEVQHNPVGSLTGGPGARVVDFLDPERNQLAFVYCIANLADRGKIVGVMSYEELLNVALCSESFNPKADNNGKKKDPSGPWIFHGGEMAKKSILRRDQKTWPRVSSTPDRLDAAIEVEQAAEEAEGRVTPGTAPASPAEPITEDQAKNIRKLALQQKLPIAKFCETFEIEKVETLPSDRYQEAESKLTARLQAYQKARSEEARDAA